MPLEKKIKSIGSNEIALARNLVQIPFLLLAPVLPVLTYLTYPIHTIPYKYKYKCRPTQSPQTNPANHASNVVRFRATSTHKPIIISHPVF